MLNVMLVDNNTNDQYQTLKEKDGKKVGRCRVCAPNATLHWHRGTALVGAVCGCCPGSVRSLFSALFFSPLSWPPSPA